MIVVRVELWPFGEQKNASTLGIMCVANDGSGTKTKGNYKAMAFAKGSRVKIWKDTEIKNFPRKKLLHWDLLYRVLKKRVGGRNEGL